MSNGVVNNNLQNTYGYLWLTDTHTYTKPLKGEQMNNFSFFDEL